MKRKLLLIFLTGCMVGPNYEAPELNVADQWHEEADTGDIAQEWWKNFDDPLLDKYIELAAQCNYDVLQAEANILRARALKTISASNLFPQVSADVNATKTYFSKNGPVFAIGQAIGDPQDTTSSLTGLPFSVQIPQIQNLFNALFDASWEIDLFGKTRRTVEAANAYIGSSIEQRNDTLITVMAEVARDYMELRTYQKQRALIEKKIWLNEQNTAVAKAQWEAGYGNSITFLTAEAQLDNARAELPDLISEIYRSIYSISILTGQLPEALVDELVVDSPLPKAPPHIAVGLRSDILRRRPDVRASERMLATATAAIGVAIGSFFPTFTLGANGGFQSLNLPKLFDWGSRTWSYGGDVNMPLFQGGRIVGQLHLTQALQSSAALSYQQTILNAIEDAESSLIAYEQQLKTAALKHDAASQYSKINHITQEQWQKGLQNRIAALNSEMQLVQSELQSLTADSAVLLNLVALYKSLGGGYSPENQQ